MTADLPDRVRAVCPTSPNEHLATFLADEMGKIWSGEIGGGLFNDLLCLRELCNVTLHAIYPQFFQEGP